MRVFISYSRAEFYFADDLALALEQHGVDAWLDVHRLRPADDWDDEILNAVRESDCVVLVASRRALASAHVSIELEVARQAGKPVVAALAEHVELPDALSAAARIDLCVGFEDKVRSLSEGLRATNFDAPTGATYASWGDRPAVVRAVSALLLGTALLWAAGSIWMLALGESTDIARAMTMNVIVFVLIGAFWGWLWWVFSHRRRGSATLLGVSFASGAPVATLFGSGLVILLVSSGGHLEGLELPAAALLTCLVAWLGIGAWALGSGAFYRWLPTGDAPRWMRRRMLARRGHRSGARPQAPAASITYEVECDELDVSIERALDRVLQAAGHRRTGGLDADRQILVLSNLTPADALSQKLARLGARTIVVIGAPVSLAALAGLERYQWVDHRRRNRRALDHLAASIGGGPAVAGAETVPESFARSVVPLAVIAPAVLCVAAAAGSLSAAIAGLFGADVATVYGASPSLPRSLIALLVGCAALWMAMALVARRIPLRTFAAGYATIWVLAVSTPWLLTHSALAGWSALPSLAVSALVICVCWRTLADWLPPRAVRASTQTLAAETQAWWQRPAARGVVLYTAALTLFALVTLLPLRHTGGLPRTTTYLEAMTSAGEYSSSFFCLKQQIAPSVGLPAPKTCPGDQAATKWQRSRARLMAALDELDDRGSPAAAEAAHRLQATLPSSMSEARALAIRDEPDPGGYDSAYTALISVMCEELNGERCAI